ncbi:hypothetical protein BDV59DRAFT_201787 [Aspergillus ambiguus]|uniref:uncharacterized protein n=1 Tax=Aspergillus ambiguus TaxID=176160 RepID=UPI003CCCC857
MSSQDSKLFAGVVRVLQLPKDHEKDWLSAVEKRDPSVLMAILLTLTPKLRVLAFPGGQIMMDPFGQLLHDPAFLANLRTLELEGDADLYLGYNVGEYHEFCLKRPVEKLNVKYSSLKGKSFPTSWVPGALSLENIHLEFCDLDRVSVTKLLKCCKALNTFVIDNWSQRPPSRSSLETDRKVDFDGRFIYDALLPHRDTLTLLQLEFGDSWDLGDGVLLSVDSPAKFPSFRAFSRLEGLRVSHWLLTPYPELPPSIKTFFISNCNVSVRNMTHKIAAEYKNGSLPLLEHFLIRSMDLSQTVKLPGQVIPQGGTPADGFFALRDLFKDTTVKYDISPYHFP